MYLFRKSLLLFLCVIFVFGLCCGGDVGSDVVRKFDNKFKEMSWAKKYPLHAAVKRGDKRSIGRILRKSWEKLDEKDDKGFLPEGYIPQNNDKIKNFFKYIKEHPLHIAAILGNVKALKHLVENKGKNINVTWEGETPLYTAVSSYFLGTVKYLSRQRGVGFAGYNYKGRTYTPLHRAAERGALLFVKSLLSAGAYVDEIGSNSFGINGTPLHGAVHSYVLRRYEPWLGPLAKSIMFSCIKLLLKRGANTNTKGYDGMTPLYIATWGIGRNKEGFDLIKLLVSKKANPGSQVTGEIAGEQVKNESPLGLAKRMYNEAKTIKEKLLWKRAQFVLEGKKWGAFDKLKQWWRERGRKGTKGR